MSIPDTAHIAEQGSIIAEHIVDDFLGSNYVPNRVSSCSHAWVETVNDEINLGYVVNVDGSPTVGFLIGVTADRWNETASYCGF